MIPQRLDDLVVRRNGWRRSMRSTAAWRGSTKDGFPGRATCGIDERHRRQSEAWQATNHRNEKRRAREDPPLLVLRL